MRELEALDLAVYRAIAGVPTPLLDRHVGRLSEAADHSKLWLAASCLLAVGAGPRGRRAAVAGLRSIAVTSAVVNVVLKPLGGRRRPDVEASEVVIGRRVPMPRSTSFPSGHAASAFAFAAGVEGVLPAAGIPLHAAAAVVAYSRVHAGVHYPLDVIVGALAGSALARVLAARSVTRAPSARRRTARGRAGPSSGSR